MSFVSTNIPPAAADEPAISPGPFWPDVEPAKIRDAHRIDGTVTAARLKDTLIEAMATTNGELSTWKNAQLLAGHAKLADVPADKIGDVSIKVHRYLRAVGCLAKAILTERYRDIDTTGKGDRKADVMEPTIDDLRRDYRWAIADIQGACRSTVELI